MLTNPPVPYDLCVFVYNPILCLLNNCESVKVDIFNQEKAIVCNFAKVRFQL